MSMICAYNYCFIFIREVNTDWNFIIKKQLFRRSLEIVLIVILENVDIFVFADSSQILSISGKLDIENLTSSFEEFGILFPVNSEEYFAVLTTNCENGSPIPVA
jgi:hypothetical protein